MTMKRKVFETTKWSDKLGFYAGEDIDFSIRVHQAGYHIIYNPYSTAMHMDERYTSEGKSDVVKLSWQDWKKRNVI
jgi:GT2 family glycosyltransferase